MATYYAVNAGGTWTTAATWSTVSAKDASRVGNGSTPTNADTCYLDDYSGSVTVGTAGTCAVMDCTGYTGTLTLNATLTVAGNITLASGMTLAGSGTLTCSAAATITSNGISGANLTWTGTLNLGSGNKTINSDGTTWPGFNVGSSMTVTLASALQATVLSIVGATTTAFDGAYDITAGTFQYAVATPSTLTLERSQTLTVTGTLILGGGYTYLTVKSDLASTATNFVFNGTAANCACCRVLFTDVAYSGSTVTTLDNWYGGTLTRTSGITNRTSADIGGGTGGVTGRCLQLGVGVC